jgi:hypothetical protein
MTNGELEAMKTKLSQNTIAPEIATVTADIIVRGRVLITYSLDVILHKSVGNVKMTHLLEHVV